MVVTVMGPNFTGKTTLAESSVDRCRSRFFDIRHYRDYLDPSYFRAHPEGCGRLRDQLWVLAHHPRLARTFLVMLWHGGPALAFRFWKYFAIHALIARQARAQADVPAVLDEGVVNKVYECVPFFDAAGRERESRRWRNLAQRTNRCLASALRSLADAVVYATVSPKVFVERAQQRDPALVGRVGEECLLNRYLLQSDLYRSVLSEARSQGLPVHEIDTEDLGSATEAFVKVLSGAGRAEGLGA